MLTQIPVPRVRFWTMVHAHRCAVYAARAEGYVQGSTFLEKCFERIAQARAARTWPRTLH